MAYVDTTEKQIIELRRKQAQDMRNIYPLLHPAPPAALRTQLVQPALMSEWLNGFLTGCALAAGLSTLAFFLIKWSAA